MSSALARGLRRHGYDVTTSHEARLLGSDDGDQLAFAASQDRVFVTQDDDFTRPPANQHHCGICYCHPEKYSTGQMIHELIVVAECTTVEEMQGRLHYL